MRKLLRKMNWLDCRGKISMPEIIIDLISIGIILLALFLLVEVIK